MRFLSQSEFILGILCNILWGLSFIASKNVLQVWEPFTASAIRFLLALIFLLISYRILGIKIQVPNLKKDWKHIMLQSCFGFGFLYPLQLTGLKYIASSVSAVIMLITPILILIFSSKLRQIFAERKKSVVLILSIIGLILLLSDVNIKLNGLSSWGVFLTLLAAISLALSYFFGTASKTTLNHTSFTFWTMFIGTIQITIGSLCLEDSTFKGSSIEFLPILSILFLALVCSAFSFAVWGQTLRSSGSEENTTSYMNIKTIVAVGSGVYFANESLTWSVLLGGSLIFISSIYAHKAYASKLNKVHSFNLLVSNSFIYAFATSVLILITAFTFYSYRSYTLNDGLSKSFILATLIITLTVFLLVSLIISHITSKSLSKGLDELLVWIDSELNETVSIQHRPQFKELEEIQSKIREMLEKYKTNRDQAVIGQLSSGILHDIKTPLQSMVAAMHLVEEQPIDTPKRLSRLENAHLMSKFNLPIICNIIETSLDGNRSIQVQKKNSDLIKTIVDATSLNEQIASLKSVQIIKEYPDTALISHDSTQFLRVINNLLKNAIEAAADSLETRIVKISLKDEIHRIKLIMEDSGSGINGDPEKIFRAFRTSKLRGTGLGLVITRKIVEAHGGSIVAGKSADLGGARLVVTIPKDHAEVYT